MTKTLAIRHAAKDLPDTHTDRQTYRHTYIDTYCPGHIIISWSPSRHNLGHFTANHLTDTDKQNSTGKYTN